MKYTTGVGCTKGIYRIVIYYMSIYISQTSYTWSITGKTQIKVSFVNLIFLVVIAFPAFLRQLIKIDHYPVDRQHYPPFSQPAPLQYSTGLLKYSVVCRFAT